VRSINALARGEGAPDIDGAEKMVQQRQPPSRLPVVGTTGPLQFDK
jgi:hypothetical protein